MKLESRVACLSASNLNNAMPENSNDRSSWQCFWDIPVRVATVNNGSI
jgi:hypothetical protein